MDSGTHRIRRAAAGLAALVVVCGLLAGCSRTVTVDGLKVSNAAAVVKSASAKLRSDNKPGLDNGSTTVSDQSTCFFVHQSKDSKNVERQLACGPIRRLGMSDSKVWDRYDLKLNQDADGKVSATVQAATDVGQSVDPSLLVSPSGDHPAKTSQIPAPQAPKTDVSNTALVTDSTNGMNLSFSALSKPYRINTPAAAIDVEATAQPQYVPLELISGGMGGDPGSAPYYRPADGQRMYAYKIKISPSPESAISYTGDLSEATVVNEASSISLGIAGGKMINIKDVSASDNSDASDSSADSSDSQSSTWTVACGASDDSWYTDASFPCKLGASKELFLLATAPSAQAPSLDVAVNGDTQTVDLATGKVTGTVSTVEYDRSALSASSGKQLIAKATERVKWLHETDTATWSETVGAISLTAFDPEKGWAPKGSAWLSVMVSNDDTSGDSYEFNTDGASMASLTAGGKTYQITDNDADNLWLFKVPDSVRTVTFKYQPHGTFTGDENDRAFTASQAAVTVTLPK